MAVAFGRIDAFDADVESWTAYTERIEHYFLANGITDAARKRSLLLTARASRT